MMDYRIADKMHYSSRKYRQLVEWIADMDNSGNGDNLEEVAGYVTVVMLAHCYKLKCIDVARDVMAVREAEVIGSRSG
jgi:hypothetical protein